MGARPFGSLLPLVVLLTAALGAGAQEGKIVGRIDIVGAQRVSRAAVMARLRTRVGAPFRAAVLREDIKALTGEKGFFLNVEVDSALLTDGKLALVFRVAEKDFIESLSLTGVADERLAGVRRVLDLERGRFVTRYDLSVRSRRLEGWYRRKGYALVQVRIVTTKAAGGGTRVRVLVDEGPRVKVDRIVFRGQRYLPERELRGRLQTREAGFFRQGVFNREILAADRVRLEEYCRARGFRDARVQLLDLLWREDFRGVTVVFGVDEGPPYIVAAIRLEGNRLFSDAELLALMQQKVGERYDGEKVQADVRAILRHYREAAHLDATFRDLFRGRPGPRLVYDLEAPRVTLVYRLEEGPKVRLGEIKIEGNELTRDKVILRQLTLAPGDYVDIREVERGLARLRGLGYFQGPGGVDGPYWEKTDRPDVRNMILRVKEGRTGRLQVGFGIGADAGFFGQFRILKENFDLTDWPRSLADVLGGRAFTGAGQTLLISAAPGTRFSTHELVFTEPALFDTPWLFSLRVFAFRQRFTVIDSDSLGLNLGLGRRLDRDLGIRDEFVTRTTFRFEITDVREPGPVDLTVPPVPLRAPARLRIHSLQELLRYASWDDPILMSRGVEGSLFAEWAGGPFGGSENYVKTELVGAVGVPLYRPAPRRPHVLGLRARFGWAEEFGRSRFVPLVERFFLGSTRWLRGFDYQGVGPRDRNGEATGGQAVWAASLEYRFPLYGEYLRGVVFCDTGSLAQRITDADLRRARVSVGFGVRIFMPFLGPQPFVLDFAFPLRREPGDERRVVSFTFGRLFF